MLDRVRAAGATVVARAGCPGARCAPIFAMTRERETRGFRATSALGFGGTASLGIRDGVPMIALTAAESEGL